MHLTVIMHHYNSKVKQRNFGALITNLEKFIQENGKFETAVIRKIHAYSGEHVKG